CDGIVFDSGRGWHPHRSVPLRQGQGLSALRQIAKRTSPSRRALRQKLAFRQPATSTPYRRTSNSHFPRANRRYRLTPESQAIGLLTAKREQTRLLRLLHPSSSVDLHRTNQHARTFVLQRRRSFGNECLCATKSYIAAREINSWRWLFDDLDHRKENRWPHSRPCFEEST